MTTAETAAVLRAQAAEREVDRLRNILADLLTATDAWLTEFGPEKPLNARVCHATVQKFAGLA